ncbi:MAG: 30S ribosomal protein S8, partial [Bdellovibrio sp.]|nr:30S ribosomal protein S8 [Bdellovibrio sp.]
PVAELLTRIINSNGERHEKLYDPASRLKASIVRVLKEEGYIKNFRLHRDESKPFIKIYLKYTEKGEPIINGIRRVSSPGLRQYAGYEKMPRPLSGAGIAIVSTSRGVMSSQKARQAKVGGEILCEVW